jgi:hypothetical protein
MLAVGAPEPYREYCSESSSDDYCVFESGYNLQGLELSMSCNETVHAVGYAPYKELCTIATFDTEYEHCYPKFPDGCESK